MPLNLNEGKPFPIPPEKMRDLKGDIARMMNGMYETPKEHTFYNLCAHMHAVQTRLTTDDVSEEDTAEKLLDEFIKLGHELKPEKNALLAIFTSQIWNERELVEDRARLLRFNGTITQKLTMLGTLFAEAGIRWLASPEAESPLYAGMITRFKEIVGFTDSVHPSKLKNQVVVETVSSGMATAEIAAAHLAHIVITKCQNLENEGDVISREQTLATIQRAYRNIGMMLARMNQNVSVPIMNELWSDPSHFELRKEGEDYVLYLLPDRLQSITTEDGEPVWKTMRYGETTSCPAMYAVGEHSAVVPELFKTAVELIRSANDFPQK